MKPQQKQKYQSVNSEERLKIIKYFIEGSLSASQIAQITGYNLSTIKAIFRVYRNEGRIDKKQKRDRELHAQKNVAVFIVDEETRYLKFIIKQQTKKEVILRSHEKYMETSNDIVNITLQKAQNEIRNNLSNLQSKRNFDESLESILKNGIKEKEIINIPQRRNYQFEPNSYIDVKTISNLFKQRENLPLKKTCTQTSQNFGMHQEQQLSDVKRIFEFQVEEYLRKSQQENLK
ncbi:unnamed protein product (macronuclear) [Paramecium tetraurelia]|uniref:Insertion element IS150 protein InsJ-like helix-turn-helix domain-containing protein n=1 Tax=Paramecium tetraurelia TaxID=5888 RepID=A0DAU5_PARTE|nr:uncharacterized protein GSPATT00015069001 [Paramecium tetraurelia]CAK80162.1 unnamed protein product [Paramecium tetraurelia]|eukprot:XP_001447559.1 hypothetical protein (macronuclear) [Paramecium tetraurelia strain d4-2]